jgi:predicted lipoprotein with Yx(FWY)xxD motif
MRSTPSASPIRLLAVVGGLVLVVAACTSSGGSSSAPSTKPSTAAAASQRGGEAHIVAVANGAVGAYLTGAGGKTLYLFKPDSANKSTCVDACAKTWPPFTIAADDTLKPDPGVTGKLTTFARPDGTLQVAYDGVPLYYFASDTKAGETTGQGVGGKWFIVSPAGAAASPASSAKSGY